MPNSELKLEATVKIGGLEWSVSRPHCFGIVFDGPPDGIEGDYLHDILLAPDNRDSFLELIDFERLVICKRVTTNAPSYRRVRGKSSVGKLSQAEYYHHDGCSSPTKPRVVEIRFPYQDVDRNVATAIAPFPKVMKAMLDALPTGLCLDDEVVKFREMFSRLETEFPPAESWDQIQGRITRTVRRELNAEGCRAYFREVDRLADAYFVPWEMGESRLMLNHAKDLSRTLQHRRAYQRSRADSESNGSLVKRWTAEEI